MKFWIYYVIGSVALLHPHLAQKLGMLYDYFTHSDYQFWTTFKPMDLFDLVLHAGIPVILFVLGIRKQLQERK